MGEPDRVVTEDDAQWLDEVAALLLAADAGDTDAETRLLARYRADDGLPRRPRLCKHPPTAIHQSPSNWIAINTDGVDLARLASFLDERCELDR